MAANVTKDHFLKAALEIGQNGENDTLPYDIDAQFVKEKSEQLSEICFGLFERLEKVQRAQAVSIVNSFNVGAERLLVATGSHGFRITTKLHPFWNLYLNGLAFGIAEANEPLRSNRVHSYRLGKDPAQLFDRDRSWRAYKEATLADNAMELEGAVVVQTDISSFYDRIYHHRLENSLDRIFPNKNISVQIDRLLNKISSGRSFGLPVGGQCSRVLAEVMMVPIDNSLSDAGLHWHRYVDDFTVICSSQQDAYTALSVLSHALADFGLSLNRTKTTILSAKHYKEYVAAQLGDGESTSVALRELDLHFDPYSDHAQSEYDELKKSVENIDIEFLLNLEREKSQPDAFVLAQISRTLKFQDPQTAANLCATLLDPKNLDSFRASWSKIMRGIYAVRASEEFSEIFKNIDDLLDIVPQKVPHLLLPEGNVLHYLRAIRFVRSDVRGRSVREIYDRTSSHTVKRACIDCWRHWADSASFQRLRNQWQNLGSSEQRMLWLAASRFGDEGTHARKQLQSTLNTAWRVGVEFGNGPTFATLYEEWSKDVA
ncbi:RNA-directed DNA polymerase [Sphingopyxis sp. 22461]|uniref:RNA-directed DNA polymerase n=1 Tax=Sphingopyxis sp. 22461 TaxID=3453923 RepID=UPI003F87CDC2